MTVTVTQTDPTRPPVTVAVTGLPTPTLGTVTGIVQRSVDGGIRWTTVRGLAEATVTAGALPTVDDWEFRPGVKNTYRAGLNQIVDTFTRTETDEWGDTDTGQAWDAAAAAFDVGSGVGTLLHAAANTTNRTVLNTPDDIGDVRLGASVGTNASGGVSGGPASFGFAARYVDGNNHYQTYLRLNAGGSVSLVARVWFGGVSTDLDVAATALTYTGSETYRIEMDVQGQTIRARVWEPAAEPRPDWMVTETVPADRRITGGQVGIFSVRATGNTNVNLTYSVSDFIADTGSPVFLQEDDITPGLAGFWLCSTMRSFLNLPPMVIDYTEPAREGRGGEDYIAGRTLPQGRAELATSRSLTLTLRVPTLAAARRLEYVIASGDILYLQTPADCEIPYGYYRVASMTPSRVRPRGPIRLFELPLREVAAPGPDIVTAQNTFDSIFLQYGTFEAVVATGMTFEDLLDLVGDPSEVIAE